MSQAPQEQIAKVRLRFKIETETPASDIVAKIDAGLKKENAPCLGKINRNFITLQLPLEEQHYWSPTLTVTLEEYEKITTIRGLYGPRPTVWTMFVFFYSIIGLATLVIGTVGLSYKMLDKPTTILWWVPVLAIIFLSLYLVAFFGQKLGHQQIEKLHSFFENATGLNVTQ